MSVTDPSTASLHLIKIDIDGQIVCSVQLAHSDTAAQLRASLAKEGVSLPNFLFYDASGCVLNIKRESSILINELLNKNATTIRLKTDEYVLTNETKSNILETEYASDVTAKFNQTVATSSNEVIFPYSLPMRKTRASKTCPQLDFKQWRHVFDKGNLFHGIRLDKPTIRYAYRSVLKFKEVASCVPVFTFNDESYISAYIGDSLMESPFLANKFFDGDIDMTSPFIDIGINAKYYKNKNTAIEERIMYSTCSFNEPRIILTLDSSYLEATPKFIEDIDLVLKLPLDQQKTVLNEVLSNYGHVYPQKVVLGGQRYHIESHVVKGNDEYKALITAQDDFFAAFKDFAIIDVGNNDQQQPKTSNDKGTLIVLKAIGGDPSLLDDAALWAASLDDPMFWQVIKHDQFRSVLTLLSQSRQDAIKNIFKTADCSQMVEKTSEYFNVICSLCVTENILSA